ncbi:MAG: permease [Planctomycetes bacterium]|nr:permease [Planctomycetota bacterium]
MTLARLGGGVGLWCWVRPRFGRPAAAAVLTLLAVAAAAGSLFSDSALAGTSSALLAGFQAFMAGALLHVVVGHTFQLKEGLHSGAERAWSGGGGLAGLGLLALFSGLHARAEGQLAALPALEAFVQLAAQSAPALLAASLTIWITKAVVPGKMARFFHGRTRFSQALRGTVAGLPLPICSCGVIPMYRSLIQARTPAPAALAFLVAAPEVGWAAILLSLGLLGPTMPGLRLAGAALLALGVGVIVGGMAERQRRQEPAEPEPEVRPPLGERVRAGFRYGFATVVDDTAPWIVLGLLIAAVLEPTLDAGLLLGLPAGVDVLIATLIGLPLYVCASGSTPLVAVLLLKGLSPGAAIAFLLTGPATNVTTAGLLAQMHSKRVAGAFAAVMIVLAVSLGLATNALLDNVEVAAAMPHHHEQIGWFPWLALGVLGLTYLSSLLRLGVPGFLAKVVRPQTDDAPPPASCCAEPPAPAPSPCCQDAAPEAAPPPPADDGGCCGHAPKE